MGAVRLVVADLERARRFYAGAVGLRELGEAGGVVSLGAPGGPPLVELVGDPDAPAPPPRATGLFHLALLVPGRAELAQALRRVVDAGWRFSGASDHLVSEALYLDDPEGNGIELYADRPRERWEWDGGELRMATIPLDLDSLLAELPDGTDEGMPPGTTMGHVHLKVGDTEHADELYARTLGFDVTVRGYPSALFLSAGGYHHHLGANSWQSAGGQAPPPGSRGLDRFEVLLPDSAALDQFRQRLGEAEEIDGGLLAADPSGNRVLLKMRK